MEVKLVEDHGWFRGHHVWTVHAEGAAISVKDVDTEAAAITQAEGIWANRLAVSDEDREAMAYVHGSLERGFSC